MTKARAHELQSIQLLITAENLALYLLRPEVGSIALALERGIWSFIFLLISYFILTLFPFAAEMLRTWLQRGSTGRFLLSSKLRSLFGSGDTSKRKRLQAEINVNSFLDVDLGASANLPIYVDKEKEKREKREREK